MEKVSLSETKGQTKDNLVNGVSAKVKSAEAYTHKQAQKRNVEKPSNSTILQKLAAVHEEKESYDPLSSHQCVTRRTAELSAAVSDFLIRGKFQIVVVWP